MNDIVKKPLGRPRGYADREGEIISMIRSGMTIREIERLTGVPRSIVHRLSQEIRSS